MTNPTDNPFAVLRHPFLIGALGTVLLVGLALSLVLHLSLFIAPLFVVGILSLVLLFQSPLLLLFLLVIVRMSLDYSSQYVSITLYDITLTLS